MRLSSIQIGILNIVAISDTHGQHQSIQIPDSDVVIHCGDASKEIYDLEEFFQWFSNLPNRYKIFIPGNHDLLFDLEPESIHALMPDNVCLLDNREIVINGIRFYGLNARPWMHQYQTLPSEVDVLISHGPPLGILDENMGCPLIRKLVDEYAPKHHLFGHIHSQGGKTITFEKTTFHNCAFDIKTN